MMRVRIKTDNYGVGQEAGDLIIGVIGLEDFAIDGGQEILAETSDGFGGAQNRAADSIGIKFDQCAVTLLDFNNSVLDRHARGLYMSGLDGERRSWTVRLNESGSRDG